MQDKGKLTVQSVGWDWPQWESPFYKKQNEIIVAALEKTGALFPFPTYTHAEPEKKSLKKPALKPGDDWWIEL
jgi:isoleucyl-tRNA synthetase